MPDIEGGASNGAAEVGTAKQTDAQVIGSAVSQCDNGAATGRWQRRSAAAATKMSGSVDAQATTTHGLGSMCSRASVLLLALAAAGAAAAAGVHVHNADRSVELRAEVERLRASNKALEQRASLAKTEQEDIARLILKPRGRKWVAGMLARSEALAEFARVNGFKSEPANTVSVRECLGRAIFELKISSILDVPCGSGSWQHLIPGITNLTYVGADINVEALEKAKHRETSVDAGLEFMLFDPVHFPLRRTFDLVLFRDIIEQQPVADTLLAIMNFKSSGSRLLAATYWPNSHARTNLAAYNLPQAGWYEANILEDPFIFPEPLLSCENGDEGTTYHSRQKLGIWRLEDLHTVNKQAVTAAKKRGEDPSSQWTGQTGGMLEGLHKPAAEQRPAAAAQAPKANRRDTLLRDVLDAFGAGFAPMRLPSRVGSPKDQRPGTYKVGNSSSPLGSGSMWDDLITDFLQSRGRADKHDERRPKLLSDLFSKPLWNSHPLN